MIDEIFSLNEEYNNDKRKNKVNCGIGVYLDDRGKPYIPLSVKKAVSKLQTKNFNYLPISGDQLFLKYSSKLIFASKNSDIFAKQGVMGGTNGVFMWGSFVKRSQKKPKILIGVPTWENHINIFRYLDFKIIKYKHLENNKYNMGGFQKAMFRNKKAYLLFHGGSTHNPTGINPSKKEWEKIANLVMKNGNSVLFDFAYCGLGESVDDDAFPIRLFLKKNIDISVVFSLSKNMSLYQHRTGALFIKARSKNKKIEFEKTLQGLFRIVNSNPSAFGEKIVSLVLSSPKLRNQWYEDIFNMTRSLIKRRKIFARKTGGKFDYILKGSGLFSLLRLNKNQIKILKRKYAIYLLSDGRINFGGLSKKNLSYVAKSLLEVFK